MADKTNLENNGSKSHKKPDDNTPGKEHIDVGSKNSAPSNTNRMAKGAAENETIKEFETFQDRFTELAKDFEKWLAKSTDKLEKGLKKHSKDISKMMGYLAVLLAAATVQIKKETQKQETNDSSPKTVWTFRTLGLPPHKMTQEGGKSGSDLDFKGPLAETANEIFAREMSEQNMAKLY